MRVPLVRRPVRARRNFFLVIAGASSALMSPDIYYRVRTDVIDRYGKLTLRRAGRLHHLAAPAARLTRSRRVGFDSDVVGAGGCDPSFSHITYKMARLGTLHWAIGNRLPVLVWTINDVDQLSKFVVDERY
jgi:hypothetical protein